MLDFFGRFFVSFNIVNIPSTEVNVKNLILMRHAKSDWSGNVDDFERVLTKRGQKNCQALRTWFTENKIKPDVALVSSAKRTQLTFELIFGTPEIRPVSIQYQETLYEGDSAQIIQTIRKVASTHNTILVIAHNPSISQAAYSLCMLGQKESLSIFPTGAFAMLSFPKPKFEYNSGELIHFISGQTLMSDYR